MAVLGIYEARVVVNGIPAREYNDDEDDNQTPQDPPSITKYVEAISGALFEFKAKIDQAYQFSDEDVLVAYAYVDGHYGGGHYATRKHFRHGAARVVVDGRTSTEKGSSKHYKFKFADLETRDMESGDDLSQVQGKVFRTWNLQCRIMASGCHCYVTVDVPVQEHTTIALLDRKPLVKFNFKYRTRRALQSLMILERSPTPLPLEERPVEELSREEMAELLRRQREQLEIKQENAGVKRERAGTVTEPRPLKCSKGENGEVIYHLDSDSDDEKKERVKPERQHIDLDNDGEEDGATTDPEIEVVELL